MNENEVTPEILNVLRSMELFQGKDVDELIEWLGKPTIEVGAECLLVEFAAGDCIITERSFGNSFYILIRGTVRVSQGPEAVHLSTHHEGSFFGEMTLISVISPKKLPSWCVDKCTASGPCETRTVPRIKM